MANLRTSLTALRTSGLLAALLVFGLVVPPVASVAANTPGTATFRVTTTTYNGRYAPRHVLAIWVADANGNFVKTLERRANNRQQYLYQWNDARSGVATVDGLTSATINTHQTHNVTWDCEDNSGAVVPDGTYRFMVEFTEANAQGQWTSSGLPFVKGTAPVSATPANSGNFTSMQITYTPAAQSHDLAVASLLGPATANPDSTVALQVQVNNVGSFTESFSVTVSNMTAGTLIGSQTVSSLAGNTATTVTINWDTAGLSVGEYQLRATAGPVADELNTADNAATTAITLRDMVHDIGVTRVSAPAMILLDSTVNFTVTVTNAGDYTEDISVNLHDLTAGQTLGSASANNVAALAAANVTIPWTATNVTLGLHTLQAVAQPVTGEILLGNNTNTLVVPISTGTTNGTTNVVLVAAGSDWRYNDTGTDLTQTAWKEIGYDDSSWDTGAAPLGYGDTGMATTLSYGGSSSNKRLTYYFRQAFTLDTLPIAMRLRVRRDDGVVIYVNGQEVLRNNMPGGEVTYSTRASSAIGGDDETAFNEFEITPANLVMGANLLAVELHQVNPTSSDLALDAELSAVLPNVSVDTTDVTLIARGSEWRYNDTGSDLSQSGWSNPTFNDTAWAAGPAPLGYGDSGFATTLSFGDDANNKRPAYYFRHSFIVDLLPLSLTLDLRRDDGAVVFLNGVEVARDNLPAGAIEYSTWATSAISGSGETAFNRFDLSAAGVVLGENVLAVELHQANPDSSDLGFDAELIATQPNIPIIHEVSVTGLHPENSGLAGDWINVQVGITNLGNATETVTIYLRDQATGEIVGTQTVKNLAPNTGATTNLIWRTLGASAGDCVLEAFTVVGGVTNVAGVATATGVIEGTGFGLQAAATTGSIGGNCRAVTLTSGHVLAGAGATLEILDRTVPAAPVRVGSLRLPGLIEALAVVGNTVVAACGNAGVHFVDISNPALPEHRNTFNSSGHAYDVAASGELVYLADGKGGVRVLNVAEPANPTVAGAFYPEGPARAIEVHGDLLFVLDSYKGLWVLDAANPAALTVRGQFNGLDAGQALAVAGELACAVDGHGRLYTINVANPAAPALSGTVLLNALARSVALDGSRAYVAAGDNGVLTVDVTDAGAPTVLATTATAGAASGLAADGSLVYVANGFAGLRLLNLETPESPAVVATLAVGLRGADVAVVANHAYVAAGESGLLVFDIANPATPVQLGVLPEAANARSVAVADGLACVGDSLSGIKVINVAHPAAPALAGQFQDAAFGSVRSLAMADGLAAFTDGKTIGLLDLSDPANPTLRGRQAAPAFAYQVAVANGHVFAACGAAGVFVLDSSAAPLGKAAPYDTPGVASALSISGNRAVVADGPAGWILLDIADPAAPAVMGSSAQEGTVQNVALFGNTATIGGATNWVRAFDVSTPLTPVPQANFGPLMRALRLAMGGHLAAAAEGEAGVAILQVAEPGADADGDGLPDTWEQQIVDADPDDALASIHDVRPTDDFDGDGLSNAQELLAGTLPTSAASVFAAACGPEPGGLGTTVRWASAAGKFYTVYKSTNLADGFQAIETDIPANPPMNAWTDPVAGGAAFYLIGVR